MGGVRATPNSVGKPLEMKQCCCQGEPWTSLLGDDIGIIKQTWDMERRWFSWIAGDWTSQFFVTGLLIKAPIQYKDDILPI